MGKWSPRPLWWGIGLLGVVALFWGTPRLLRRAKFFRVRQLELVGVQNLAPEAVIRALRLRPGASVFDETAPLAERVKELTGVADARVMRRLPGALRVVVREVDPVAFVPGGAAGLVVVDAAGHRLPFDPARTALDLPVVQAADSGVTGVLALVQSMNPALFRDVTAARRYGRSDVLLELGPRRVLLARDAGPEVIRAVVLVSQDLAGKAAAYAELDARFAGQIIVRRRAGGGA